MQQNGRVVRQMQESEKPTMQLRGVAINDDSALEREADQMGGKAEGRGEGTLQFADTQSDTLAQQKLQKKVNTSLCNSKWNVVQVIAANKSQAKKNTPLQVMSNISPPSSTPIQRTLIGKLENIKDQYLLKNFGDQFPELKKYKNRVAVLKKLKETNFPEVETNDDLKEQIPIALEQLGISNKKEVEPKSKKKVESSGKKEVKPPSKKKFKSLDEKEIELEVSSVVDKEQLLLECLTKAWDSSEDKKETILSSIKKVYEEKAVEATKDPLVVKTILNFVNSKQSKEWVEGTKRKPPNKNDIGKLKDIDNWTIRHYTDKYVWDEDKKEVKPPSYTEILSSLTLAAMKREKEEDKPKEKGKVGASKSGHTSKIDWDVIGNVGDTFYGLFYQGKLAGQHQTFLDDAQWYAEWKISEVTSEIWASSDWLGTAKANKGKPRGDAYEGKPEDVISSFLGMFGRRGDADSKRKFFESGFDNFEVKVHGPLKLKGGWKRVEKPPKTEEEKSNKL